MMTRPEPGAPGDHLDTRVLGEQGADLISAARHNTNDAGRKARFQDKFDHPIVQQGATSGALITMQVPATGTGPFNRTTFAFPLSGLTPCHNSGGLIELFGSRSGSARKQEAGAMGFASYLDTDFDAGPPINICQLPGHAEWIRDGPPVRGRLGGNRQ